MNIYIYENQSAIDFDPISNTRATCDIRIGAETFLERIQFMFPDASISLIVRDELAEVTKERHCDISINPESVEDGLWLLGNVIWEEGDLKQLANQECSFYSGDILVGAYLSKSNGTDWMEKGGPTHCDPPNQNKVDVKSVYCQYLWNILDQLPKTVLAEFNQKANRVDPKNFPEVSFMNPGNIFVGEATIQPRSLINAEKGPVIIDDGVLIHGQSYLEGPLYIGPESMIKPFTQIKNSAIGPMCKIGGEVDTVIIQGFTNKVHDGHLGDAFLGEWVNLGAGTINSNLKNNYSLVSVQINGKNVKTGSEHIGCFLGDHVKTAIGTTLNTGTVLGPGAMIATDGFPPKTIRPFTWYVNGKHRTVLLDKFLETAYQVKERRGQNLTKIEISMFKKIQNDR
ncbi:MAG: hypothetical protein ISR82_03205 [Candidatus Marinimicrobia bacterium]|nr:hypothetical protein [Candidatus Neomarinimicrobiota bacterium]MBL7010210.1 hypothetical protein [Candidatus Neomarinimicrobiota bacterium]MBL7030623.1 hypothetical protein [Candidatus Neomarinimicrobiota bacterium]